MGSRHDNSMTPLTRMGAVAIGATSTRSTQFPLNAAGNFYRLSPTSSCFYVIDGNIDSASLRTATTDDAFLQAGAIEVVQIPQGGWISVIQQSAAGSLTIVGMR